MSAKNTYIRNVYIRNICIKHVFVKDFDTVKHLKIHLQLSQILKVK